MFLSANKHKKEPETRILAFYKFTLTIPENSRIVQSDLFFPQILANAFKNFETV